MGWHDLKRWLRWGIIGFLIGVGFIGFSYLLAILDFDSGADIMMFLGMIVGLPVSYVMILVAVMIVAIFNIHISGGGLGLVYLIAFLSIPLNLFFWGALIGDLIDKKKKKNRNL